MNHVCDSSLVVKNSVGEHVTAVQEQNTPLPLKIMKKKKLLFATCTLLHSEIPFFVYPRLGSWGVKLNISVQYLFSVTGEVR